MRWLFLLVCLTSFSFPAGAQEQERRLADRLLRPDMSLVNPAQDKKFIAAGGTSGDQEFVAKSFSTGDAAAPRSFGGTKGFFARIFGTKNFARAGAAADTKSNAEIARANTPFATGESSLVRPSSDATKTADAGEYAEQRPFLGQGTRQKMLSQKNKPLTIDEVRELLNKNK